MIIFASFVNILHSALKDKEFRALLYFVLFVIFSGAIFYMRVENWSFLDALYFSVITLTTVGYGDISPVTDIGKAFTIIYILVGLGVMASFITTLGNKTFNKTS